MILDKLIQDGNDVVSTGHGVAAGIDHFTCDGAIGLQYQLACNTYTALIGYHIFITIHQVEAIADVGLGQNQRLFALG